MREYSSDQFSFKNGQFTAESSELTAGRNVPLMDRLFNDAIDVGIIIRSVKTGIRKVFVFHDQYERDGDITHWELHELTTRVNRGSCLYDQHNIVYDRGSNLRVVIFND